MGIDVTTMFVKMRRLANYMFHRCYLLSILMVCPAASFADSNFKAIHLKYGVTVDLPNSWRTLTSEEVGMINSSTEAVYQAAGLDKQLGSYDQSQQQNLISVNSTPAYTYASFSASLNDDGPTFSDLANINNQNLLDFDRLAPSKFSSLFYQIKASLITYYGTTVDTVNGYPAIVSKLKRTGYGGPVIVRIIQTATRKHGYRFNFGYRESEERIWKAVLDRVKSSITLE